MLCHGKMRKLMRKLFFEGSNPTGEFFNPAYDCSDALDKTFEAKDGFYWIKLSGNVSKKVLHIHEICSLSFTVVFKLFPEFCFSCGVT